jgi:hypothetical protein
MFRLYFVAFSRPICYYTCALQRLQFKEKGKIRTNFYRMLFDIKEFSVAPEWHGAQLRLTNGAVQTVEQVGMRLYEFPPIEIVSCAVGREGEPEASREKETARRRRKTRTTTSKTFRS